jgi:hypothetical protein
MGVTPLTSVDQPIDNLSNVSWQTHKTISNPIGCKLLKLHASTADAGRAMVGVCAMTVQWYVVSC